MLWRLAQPEWLLALALLPLLAWLCGAAGGAAAVRFPSVAIARQVAGIVHGRRGRWRPRLRWLTAALLIVALARPQSGSETDEIRSSGIDIVMAVDLSTSMWAHDFEIAGVRQDRLTVLRSVMRDFIGSRPADRIGLVAFAAYPYLVSPVTLNHDWLLRRLDDLRIGMIEDGTAIGSAISTGVNRLRGSDAASRILILLTDGASNRGPLTPMQAAEAAAALGIKVYTIGIGRSGLVPYPRIDPRSGQPMRDHAGRNLFVNAPSEIDLESLQRIAERTGGAYYHAQNTEQLRGIYGEIDRLEKSELRLTVRRDYRDAHAWPLALAAACLLLEWLLRFTRHHRLP
jgi:Ca-activated chloride channel family protein